MSNSSLLNGLPMWVKGIAVVGVPSLIAFYLVLVVTGAIPSALSSEHEQIQTQQATEQTRVREEHKAQEQARQEQSQLLRLICANTAKSEAVSLECLRSR